MSTEHLIADRWRRQMAALVEVAPEQMPGMTAHNLGVIAAILVAAQFIGDSVPDLPDTLKVRLTQGWPPR